MHLTWIENKSFESTDGVEGYTKASNQVKLIAVEARLLRGNLSKETGLNLSRSEVRPSEHSRHIAGSLLALQVV